VGGDDVWLGPEVGARYFAAGLQLVFATKGDDERPALLVPAGFGLCKPYHPSKRWDYIRPRDVHACRGCS
jgi:hypothetical protein